MKPAKIGIIIALVLVSTILFVSVQYGTQEKAATDGIPPILEFTGYTNLIASNITSISELKPAAIQKPDEVLLPYGVKKFALVRFDQYGLNNEIRSGNGIRIKIRGQEYHADLDRGDFENIDDGIDSYSGTLSGVKNSNVLLTISDDCTVASITLGDETFEIEPVEYGERQNGNTSLVHIIFSSKDVAPIEFLIDK